MYILPRNTFIAYVQHSYLKFSLTTEHIKLTQITDTPKKNKIQQNPILKQINREVLGKFGTTQNFFENKQITIISKVMKTEICESETSIELNRQD